MLPRRRIVQALPQTGLRVQGSTASSRTIRSTVGNGRQFGTMKPGLVGNAGLRVKVAAPALSLGSVASSRNISLWGWGSSKPEAPASETLASNDSSSKIAEIPAEPASAMPSLSTSTAPGAPPAISPAADLTTTAPANDGMTALNDLIAQHADNILTRPEHIGYLKELGLDYGWGPTAVTQWALEHVHIYTGLGWGASIAALAVLIRVAFFYPQVLSMRNNAKMTEMRKDARFEQSMELMKQGQMGGGQEAINKGRFIQQKLMQEYDVAYKRMLWGMAPIPFTYGMFRTVSGMGSLPVPSFENAGYLWFTDLAATDPYYILPFVSVGMMVAGMKVMGRLTPAENRGMMNKMMYGMGGLMAVVGLWFSAGVHVMGISLGSATLLQSFLLSNKTIRRACSIPDIDITPKEPLPTEAKYEPPRSMMERLKNTADQGQESMEKFTNTLTGRASETKEDKAIRARRERIKKIEQERHQQEEAEFNRKYKR